jgi:Flp pilus assembly protein TadB
MEVNLSRNKSRRRLVGRPSSWQQASCRGCSQSSREDVDVVGADTVEEVVVEVVAVVVTVVVVVVVVVTVVVVVVVTVVVVVVVVVVRESVWPSG